LKSTCCDLIGYRNSTYDDYGCNIENVVVESSRALVKCFFFWLLLFCIQPYLKEIGSSPVIAQ